MIQNEIVWIKASKKVFYFSLKTAALVRSSQAQLDMKNPSVYRMNCVSLGTRKVFVVWIQGMARIDGQHLIIYI